MSYKALYNITTLEGIDALEAVNITVESLIVEDSISLPDNVITSDSIISLDGNKINNGLYIDDIYEKTNSHAIRTRDELQVWGGLVLMTGDNLRKFNIFLPYTSSTNRDLYIPDMPGYGSDYIMINNVAATITNKTINGANNTFLNVPNSALISIDGNKINDPIYVNNLYEKTPANGIDIRNDTYFNQNASFYGDVSFYDMVDTFRVKLNLTGNALDRNSDITFPQNIQAVDEIVLRDTACILTNKSISGSTNTFSNVPMSALTGYINANQISSGLISNTEFDYLDGLNQNLATTSNVKHARLELSTGEIRNNNLAGISKLLLAQTTSSYTVRVPTLAFSTDDTLLSMNEYQNVQNKTLVTNCYFYDNTSLGALRVDLTGTTSSGSVNLIASPSATRNITLPNATGTIVLKDTSDNLTNKTLTSMVFSGTHTGTFNTSGLNYNSNTTDSTSTTSNSAIRTLGGVSVAKNLYALNLYGNNLTTAYHCIRLNNSAVQAFGAPGQARLVLNTTEYNPSLMTTVLSSGNYYAQINKTGKYIINASSYVYFTGGTGTFQGLYIYSSGTILAASEFRFTYQISMNVSWSGTLTSGNQIFLEGYGNGSLITFGIVSGIPYTKTQLSIMYVGE